VRPSRAPGPGEKADQAFVMDSRHRPTTVVGRVGEAELVVGEQCGAIDSTRAGASYMGIATPYWTSVMGSWRTWLGS
jgi:hypothetical protein